jgi:hypothetical protein
MVVPRKKNEGYFRFDFARFESWLPFELVRGGGLIGALVGVVPAGVVFGSSLRSAMPHRLDAMKYKHNPLATL